VFVTYENIAFTFKWPSLIANLMKKISVIQIKNIDKCLSDNRQSFLLILKFKSFDKGPRHTRENIAE
jgi:hypothetical protein